MAMLPQRSSRLRREYAELQTLSSMAESEFTLVNADHAADVGEAWVVEFSGPSNSPFAPPRRLQVSLSFPPRYPFEPPLATFLTPIWHPNVDEAGRICLDLLRGPPTGNWRPTVSLMALLASIRLLLGEPNPDDPLVPEAAREWITNRPLYMAKARGHPLKHDQMEEKNEHGDHNPSSLVKGEERDLSRTEQDSAPNSSLSIVSLTHDGGDESLLSRLSKRRKRRVDE